jgi:hypothetical protein
VSEVEEKAGAQLQVRYVRSTAFRVLHADGVYGGVLPSLKIHMSFYEERGPLPNRVTYAISPEGAVKEASEIEIEEGIIREVETTVTMTLDMCKVFLEWLREKIDLAEALKTGTAKAIEE